VTRSNAEDFIRGTVRPGMAGVFGTTTATTQEFRNKLDEQGAIGVLIGICIDRPKQP